MCSLTTDYRYHRFCSACITCRYTCHLPPPFPVRYDSHHHHSCHLQLPFDYTTTTWRLEVPAMPWEVGTCMRLPMPGPAVPGISTTVPTIHSVLVGVSYRCSPPDTHHLCRSIPTFCSILFSLFGDFYHSYRYLPFDFHSAGGWVTIFTILRSATITMQPLPGRGLPAVLFWVSFCFTPFHLISAISTVAALPLPATCWSLTTTILHSTIPDRFIPDSIHSGGLFDPFIRCRWSTTT